MEKVNSDITAFKIKLERIEEISELLEDQDLDLEQAIKLYEEGMILSQECLKSLQAAEVKITELKNSFNTL
ncbi:MAG: exodeoxyribonuclease VII small subunit [Ignavibacteriales bacterium]|jgi:exodeoxyribonuclease VII small subunit|nr:exodeoxyribonuclease VII small subunit [Ignavibacteriales bacterium]MBP7542931.1 exodeoxyribonuclease VII small subunit [Ignavibacteriaceae bacterium]MBK7264903.1 exodeoxyribonuclease VII small subunit [Ignavibacteriales bacterium]MBK8662045.1 exodeoxyribonuclease VII small subunit [Ignavibacteriales bacterium]MBP9121780.1 exodeoxyribonuclease VII small subunit [Ignavibacteriaceae bacterium]